MEQLKQQNPRTFVALSEYADGESADAIRVGTWAKCVDECVHDDAPCYVVEMLISDVDGDEQESNDILFVNKAWNRRHVK